MTRSQIEELRNRDKKHGLGNVVAILEYERLHGRAQTPEEAWENINEVDKYAVFAA